MSQEQKNQTQVLVLAVLFLVGLIFMALTLAAPWLGLDINKGFGVVQMFVLLLGITLMAGSSLRYVTILRRPYANTRSLQADIGFRLALTGLVFVYVSGLSDLLGIGTHTTPDFELPFVGPLQLSGLLLGVLSIVVGLFIYATSRGRQGSSSLEFLFKRDEQKEV